MGVLGILQGFGRSDFSAMGLHPDTLSKWFPAPRGRPTSLPCPLPAWALGCPGSAPPSSPEENVNGPRTEKSGRGAGGKRGQHRGRTSWRQNPLHLHARVLEGAAQDRSRIRLTALLAPPGDAPDLALQSKRLARQAPPKPTRIPAPQGVSCRSRQGLAGPAPHPRPAPGAGPPPGPMGPARHAPPGPSASSALALCAPASLIRTRTQPPPAARPSRDSPALGL